MVRKGTAPAFSLDNIRKAFPRLLEVGYGRAVWSGTQAAAPRCLRGFAGSGMQGTDEWLACGHAMCRTDYAICTLPLHLQPLPTQATSAVCDVLAARCAAGGGECEAEVSEAAMRITLDLIGTTGYGWAWGGSIGLQGLEWRTAMSLRQLWRMQQGCGGAAGVQPLSSSLLCMLYSICCLTALQLHAASPAATTSRRGSTGPASCWRCAGQLALGLHRATCIRFAQGNLR